MSSRALRSTKTVNENSTEDLTDKIWSNFETKLKEWTQNVLPTLVEEPLKTNLKQIVYSEVDKYVSSSAFQNALSDSLNFDIKSFEEKLKDKANKMADLEEKNKLLQDKLEQLEQYTRRTNIRIFGIPENKDEDTDQLVREFCKKELNLDLKNEEISRSHRVGKKRILSSRHPRPIIVRLARHNTKVEILKKRRELKSKKRPFGLQEDLTESRRAILKYLRDEDSDFKISKAWTIDGTIFFRPSCEPNTVERCTTMEECRRLVDKYI